MSSPVFIYSPPNGFAPVDIPPAGTVFVTANQGGTAQVPVLNTAPLPAGVANQNTGTPIPANVGTEPQLSTVLSTASRGLADIVLNPSQHIIAIVVILLVAWWLHKHW